MDEDLKYMGPDRELARIFGASDRKQGWRVVSMGSGVYPQAEDAVQKRYPCWVRTAKARCRRTPWRERLAAAYSRGSP
jgi:hypothetical protein